MVDNHLLAYKATTSASAVPMSIHTVTTAISIAQKHIEQMQDEIFTPTAALALKVGEPKMVLKVGSKLVRTVEFEDEDVTAETLAAEFGAEQRTLPKKQSTLALITTGTAAQGYHKAGAAPQNTLPCKICGKTHAGDQPESKCFQSDIAAERKELDEPEKHQTEMKERSDSEGASSLRWVHEVPNKRRFRLRSVCFPVAS
eukprot:760849-Rhodomonas_salina.1